MTRALAILSSVLALVAGGLLLAWRHDRAQLVAARAAAEGAAEAERVEKSGVIAAAKVAQDEMERRVATLNAESTAFREETERQLAAAKGRIEALLKLQTGTLVASGDPKPPGPAAGPPDRPCPPCLLAPGDHGDVLARVSQVRYEHGTLSVAGDVEAARLDPDGSRHVILAGPWSAARSTAIEVPREVVTERARFAVLGGVVNPWSPSGGYGGAGLRVVGPLWVEAMGVVDGSRAAGLVGARWEVK